MEDKKEVMRFAPDNSNDNKTAVAHHLSTLTPTLTPTFTS